VVVVDAAVEAVATGDGSAASKSDAAEKIADSEVLGIGNTDAVAVLRDAAGLWPRSKGVVADESQRLWMLLLSPPLPRPLPGLFCLVAPLLPDYDSARLKSSWRKACLTKLVTYEMACDWR